ncbi:MAG TPA: hypothetical protein VFI37_03645 [Gaiellaceae bacterium]|jgi:hypothetical protein|nr:hypothetical protein [Gaiellaceae bacterium]
MSRRSGQVASLSAIALAAVLGRFVSDRGGMLRLSSLLLHRLRHVGARRDASADDSRLYARRRRRLEAHLGRLRDGRCAVVALPLDGTGRAAVYPVDELRPWHDFERQADLVGAPWGPCLSVSAGL